MHSIIEINKGITRIPEFRLNEPVTVKIPADGPLAIIGLNAAGKTKLVDILTGAHPLAGTEVEYDFSPSESKKVSANIKQVTFRDAYGSADGDFYQLRWNQGLLEQSATVEEILRRTAPENKVPQNIIDVLGLKDLLPKQMIMLSSGELRRVQLAEVLQASPRLLLLDNPYIGLDVNARRQTTEFLAEVSRQGKTKLIIIVSREKDVPDFVEQVLPVVDGKVLPVTGKKEFFDKLHAAEENKSYKLDEKRRAAILALPDSEDAGDGKPVVDCRNINIGYGTRKILKDFSWTVRTGERWALSGENGAGKSTLLSLVCADNPQAYACDISLFGFRRGSGESIWDIKKKIGYVSPEMYRTYRRNISVLKIITSGLSDTTGLFYNEPSEQQKTKALFWLDIFGISDLAGRNYLKLSSGEQRMVLLARAFVKDPELLVLDEPFHGLDRERRELARSVINTFCSRKGKTLIMVTHYAEEYPECVDHKLTLIKNV